MQQFFGGVVNRKRLLGVFSGITEGFLSAEDYMIDTSSIVLDPGVHLCRCHDPVPLH